MATICNMGAETGATTSLFPYTAAMGDYLNATSRSYLNSAASRWGHNFSADADAKYDHLININLSEIEPYINGPSTPDLATPLSKFKTELAKNSWPKEVSVGLLGSCTNSSFEDMNRAANLAKQALDAGLKPKAPLMISPGSEQTRVTLEEAGIMKIFEESNATLLANACGPCCGSWDRENIQKVSTIDPMPVNAILMNNRERRTQLLLHIIATLLAGWTVIPQRAYSSLRQRQLW
jgi:aconitate hydratase